MRRFVPSVRQNYTLSISGGNLRPKAAAKNLGGAGGEGYFLTFSPLGKKPRKLFSGGKKKKNPGLGIAKKDVNLRLNVRLRKRPLVVRACATPANEGALSRGWGHKSRLRIGQREPKRKERK